jgi:hypothetical protein
MLPMTLTELVLLILQALNSSIRNNGNDRETYHRRLPSETHNSIGAVPVIGTMAVRGSSRTSNDQQRNFQQAQSPQDLGSDSQSASLISRGRRGVPWHSRCSFVVASQSSLAIRSTSPKTFSAKASSALVRRGKSLFAKSELS